MAYEFRVSLVLASFPSFFPLSIEPIIAVYFLASYLQCMFRRAKDSDIELNHGWVVVSFKYLIISVCPSLVRKLNELE